MNSRQKYNTYKALKVKLKKAMNAGFWFEAVIIEYAIMEDRTRSMLAHAGLHPFKLDDMSLHRKLKSLSNQIRICHPVISMKVDGGLIEQIQTWRVQRNRIVHEACYHPYDEDAVKEIAEKGNDLVNELINNSRRVTNYYKRLEEKK